MEFVVQVVGVICVAHCIAMLGDEFVNFSNELVVFAVELYVFLDIDTILRNSI